MKQIHVNSEQVNCESLNLAELLNELGYAGAIVATAVNGQFVAQTNRQQLVIKTGDQVEVLAPMQGG
ncbi:sulfur carrier protein ThiS [Glaciecola sp. 33A]|jgi:sulfur carrier protein|uniref:sulfur carrier protein ThiS n=1 Tax=Glaciecola sp. 33A TaxID=2057807 RepID=UPI000C3361D1|nr:sulfur carrier protein ThiS [Glaciecola sp. 33A]PKI01463.1 thiamine biosynthesis protein ThiS [Glaciecola sp. 33A]